MPQRGNKCPGLNEYHSFESGYCLKECQRQCIPPSVLVHIENKQRIDKHQGHYISVTSLLGCMRQIYLERSIDYFVEPPRNWYSMRGTLIHNILENPDFKKLVDDQIHLINRVIKRGEVPPEQAKVILDRWYNETLPSLMEIAKVMPAGNIPDWQSETEYEYPLGMWSCNNCRHVFNGPFNCPMCKSGDTTEWFLRGTLDVLRPEAGELYDYKTIGDRGLGIVKRGAKKEHIEQFNMYRFMAERGYPVGQRDTYKPIKIKKIKAFYMTMMQVVGTGSLLTEDTGFRVSEPEMGENEVGREWLAEKREMVLKAGKKKSTAGPDDYRESVKTNWRLTYAIPDVPLMPLDDVEALIKGAAPQLIEAFVNGKMPDMCSPEMRAWKCAKFCPQQVREACDKYNDSVGVSRMEEVQAVVDDDIPVEVL